ASQLEPTQPPSEERKRLRLSLGEDVPTQAAYGRCGIAWRATPRLLLEASKLAGGVDGANRHSVYAVRHNRFMVGGGLPKRPRLSLGARRRQRRCGARRRRSRSRSRRRCRTRAAAAAAASKEE